LYFFHDFQVKEAFAPFVLASRVDACFLGLSDDKISDVQGENRFIESMCQTILSVDELLWVINHPDIDCNFKKPFLRYFLWVYLKTAGSAVESGAGDLPHDGSARCRSLFIYFLFISIYQPAQVT